jgi:hypothetical protein
LLDPDYSDQDCFAVGVNHRIAVMFVGLWA